MRIFVDSMVNTWRSQIAIDKPRKTIKKIHFKKSRDEINNSDKNMILKHDLKNHLIG